MNNARIASLSREQPERCIVEVDVAEVEVRVVERIQERQPELEVRVLFKPSTLRQRKVCLEEAGFDETVDREVTERSRCRSTQKPRLQRRTGKPTGNRICSDVKQIRVDVEQTCRSAEHTDIPLELLEAYTDQLRRIGSTVEVVEGGTVGCNVERIARLPIHDRPNRPSLQHFLDDRGIGHVPAATAEWQIIDRIGDEAMPLVLIRKTAIKRQIPERPEALESALAAVAVGDRLAERIVPLERQSV